MPSLAPAANPAWPRHAASAVRDLRGGMQLVADGVQLGIDRIEAAHDRMARVEPPVRGVRVPRPHSGWGAAVYHGLRGTAGLAGGATDFALASLQASLADPRGDGEPGEPSPRREALLAVLNALVGDHLQRTGNPLVIRTRLQRAGAPAPRVLVLVHDLALDPLQERRHGPALAAAVEGTAVLAHYSTGRPVAAVGRELAAELQAMLSHWPLPLQRVALVGHGLGGLVLRSALHQAGRSGMAWPDRVRHLVFLGTPHGGADPQRVLAWVARLGAGRAAGLLPLGRLPQRHSAGIDDFIHGRVLAADPGHGRALPQDDVAGLPPTLRAHAIAGALGDGRTDGLVAVASALGRGEGAAADVLALPDDRRWVAQGVDHLGLLASDAVFRRMRQWLSA